MVKIVPQPHGGALKQAEKGDVLNPKGRPKKTIGALLDKLKDAGYKPAKPQDIVDTYEHLMTLDEAELKKAVEDKTQPMLVRIVGKAMLSGKGYDVIERMIDRAHGRSKQPIEHDGDLFKGAQIKVTKPDAE